MSSDLAGATPVTAGPRRGRLIVLSGASGSGKSTVIERALEPGDLPVRLAVSATTRAPRKGEVDGVHYHFWKAERFETAVQAGEFLEWADVYGHRYGTLRSEVDPFLAQGQSVILEIDVQGGLQVRQRMPECVTVFLRAAVTDDSERALREDRLRARKTDDPDSLRLRLQAAQNELRVGATYDHQIINDDLGKAVAALRAVIQRYGGDADVG
jgi:guanylate kinase